MRRKNQLLWSTPPQQTCVSVNGTFYRTVPTPLTLNGANDRSHCQLFESAIRLGKCLFLQTLRGYSGWDPGCPVSLGVPTRISM